MLSDVRELVEKLFSQYKLQAYAKGQIIVRADDNPLGIFYLESGQVKQYVISKKGEETIATIYKPGTYFPMSWAISSQPNQYYFEALTNATVRRAPSNEVRAFIKENPSVMYDLLTRIFIGLEGMTERMMYMMGGTAYERLIVELIILVKRFGKRQHGDNPQIEVAISEIQLAAQSGLTRETVSRELKILKDKKLILFEKSKLTVFDLDSLEEELSKTN